MPQRRTLDEFVAGVPRLREERHSDAVLEAVMRLEEKLNSLVEEVRTLAEELRSLAEAVRGLEERLSTAPGREARRKTAYDLLKEQGFVSLSSLRGKVKNPRALIDRLESKGAIVLELEDDVIAVDPGFYRSFLDELERIDTADEGEAARRLGRYSRLFEALRRTGLIYFDHRAKKWVFV